MSIDINTLNWTTDKSGADFGVASAPSVIAFAEFEVDGSPHDAFLENVNGRIDLYARLRGNVNRDYFNSFCQCENANLPEDKRNSRCGCFWDFKRLDGLFGFGNWQAFLAEKNAA